MGPRSQNKTLLRDKPSRTWTGSMGWSMDPGPCFVYVRMAQWWEHWRLPPIWPGFDSRTRGYICGLSLLLVLCSAPRGFSPGTPVFPSPQKSTSRNSNSILECTGISNKFLWIPGVLWINKLHLQFYISMHVRLRVCAPSKIHVDFLKVRFCSIKRRLGASLSPRLSVITPLSVFTSLKGTSLNFLMLIL